MLHKVIEMETFSLIWGAGACLLHLPWVGKAHLCLVVGLSESVVSSCGWGGNCASCLSAWRPQCEHQLGAFPAAGARLLQRVALLQRWERVD